MNKNWLYRVLAMALVAMLALPVFAMAEDVAALNEFDAVDEVEFDLGAEGAEEEVEINEAESNAAAGYVYLDDYDFDPYDAHYDGGDDWRVEDVAMIVVNAGQYSVSFKSNNKKVAKVHKSGSVGVVTFTGKGDATITVSAKFKPIGSKSYTLKAYVDFGVKYNDNVKYLEVFYGKAYDEDDVLNKKDAAKGKTVSMGEGFDEDGMPTKSIAPVAYDEDDDLLDYGIDESDDVIYTDGYRWSWSNADVAYFLPQQFDPDDDANGVRSLKQKKGTYYAWEMVDYEYDPETGEETFDLVQHPALKVVFNKPGTTKLTFTSLRFPKAKITLKYTVEKNKKTWKLNKNMIEDGEVYLAIKSIEVKNIDEVDVTFAVVNGTDNAYGNWTGNLSILYRNKGEETEFLSTEGEEVTLRGKAKPNAITTYKKITFKNSKRGEDDEFVPSTLKIKNPGVKLDSARSFYIELDGEDWLPKDWDAVVSVNDEE